MHSRLQREGYTSFSGNNMYRLGNSDPAFTRAPTISGNKSSGKISFPNELTCRIDKYGECSYISRQRLKRMDIFFFSVKTLSCEY